MTDVTDFLNLCRAQLNDCIVFPIANVDEYNCLIELKYAIESNYSDKPGIVVKYLSIIDSYKCFEIALINREKKLCYLESIDYEDVRLFRNGQLVAELIRLGDIGRAMETNRIKKTNIIGEQLAIVSSTTICRNVIFLGTIVKLTCWLNFYEICGGSDKTNIPTSCHSTNDEAICRIMKIVDEARVFLKMNAKEITAAYKSKLLNIVVFAVDGTDLKLYNVILDMPGYNGANTMRIICSTESKPNASIDANRIIDVEVVREFTDFDTTDDSECIIYDIAFLEETISKEVVQMKNMIFTECDYLTGRLVFRSFKSYEEHTIVSTDKDIQCFKILPENLLCTLFVSNAFRIRHFFMGHATQLKNKIVTLDMVDGLVMKGFITNVLSCGIFFSVELENYYLSFVLIRECRDVCVLKNAISPILLESIIGTTFGMCAVSMMSGSVYHIRGVVTYNNYGLDKGTCRIVMENNNSLNLNSEQIISIRHVSVNEAVKHFGLESDPNCPFRKILAFPIERNDVMVKSIHIIESEIILYGQDGSLNYIPVLNNNFYHPLALIVEEGKRLHKDAKAAKQIYATLQKKNLENVVLSEGPGRKNVFAIHFNGHEIKANCSAYGTTLISNEGGNFICRVNVQVDDLAAELEKTFKFE